jgi:hypothetical protein
MSTSEIAIFLGLAVAILATQLGRRRLTIRRLLIPLAVAGFVGFQYLHGIPTQGGDLDFIVLATAAGAACGLLVACLVRVERGGAGSIITRAGLGYAAVWVAVLGGRLAFGYLAQHQWMGAVRQFSIDHAITGSAAWTAAFVLMALAMVGARTLVIAVRALALSRQGTDRTAFLRVA